MKENQNIKSTLIKDAPIACNGTETHLIDYLKADQSFVLFFTGDKPTIDSAYLTYELYDHIDSNYKDILQPVVITKLVPLGLKDREVVLDLEGAVFKAFNISDMPKIAFISDRKVLVISEQMPVRELAKYIESNHLLNKNP